MKTGAQFEPFTHFSVHTRNLRTILIFIVVAVSLYQFFTDYESTEPVNTEPFATLMQSVENVDTSITVTETPKAEANEEEVIPEEITESLEEPTGDFDFYVMALSWSPDYCASTDYQDEQQCSIGKQLDFVLHGLWPQYNSGYPSYCSEESLPGYLIDDFAGLYPSEKLFDHEWEKHGTCTGLSPAGYLLWSEALKKALITPDIFASPAEPFRTDAAELSEAFIVVNPDFSADSFAVYCSGSGRFMKELFVCFEKDGEPRDCSNEILKKASKSCGQEDFLVRNTR